MNRDLIWSVTLSIPVSIGSGLAVPFIRRWFQKLYNWRTGRQHESMRSGFIRVFYFRHHPSEFTNYLIMESLTIVIALCAMLFGMILGTAGFISHPTGTFYLKHPLALEVDTLSRRIIGALMMFVGAYTFSKDATEMGRTFRNVTLFEEFLKKVPDDIKKEFVDSNPSSESHHLETKK